MREQRETDQQLAPDTHKKLGGAVPTTWPQQMREARGLKW